MLQRYWRRNKGKYRGLYNRCSQHLLVGIYRWLDILLEYSYIYYIIIINTNNNNNNNININNNNNNNNNNNDQQMNYINK